MKIIDGLNVTFSPKRMLGITKLKRKVSNKTGIPLTKQGFERKLGRLVANTIYHIFQ